MHKHITSYIGEIAWVKIQAGNIMARDENPNKLEKQEAKCTIR